MIGRISATVLFVENLERSMEFYRDILGLEVVASDDVSFAFRMDGQDFALVQIAAGVDMLNKGVLGSPERANRRVMMCADVDDVDAVFTDLITRGVLFIKPPIDQHWGWRTAYFADPEGNIWELREAIPAKKTAS